MNLTPQQLRAEIEEKTKDLEAFTQARSIIRARVTEVGDSECVLTPLTTWSGTDAVLGSLDLSIHAMERTLDELKGLLAQAEEKKSRFEVIKGDGNGEQG